MRTCLTLLCLMLCLQLSALDSPLIMRGQGDLTAVVNPNAGTIQLYRTSGKILNQVGSYFFLSDIEYLANRPHPAIDPEKVDLAATWTLMRMGLKTAPNILNDMKRASPKAWQVTMDSENEFWSKAPEYDGKIVGAMGQNHIFLCLPNMRCLLAYELVNGKNLNLVGCRNIGPDLMIGSVLNSKPSPKDLLKQLSKQDKSVQEAFDARVKAKEEAIANGEIIQLKESEPWMAALQNEKVVLMDPANQQLLVYELNRKMLTLKSARNLEIDLMVPPRLGVKTKPEPEQLYKSYLQSLKRSRKVPYSRQELEALVNVSGNLQKDGQDDDIQAYVDEKFNLTIDFIKQRKLLLYNPDEGGQGIVLYSVRDYTLENAIALHIDEINRENRADDMYKEAAKNAKRPARKGTAMRLLRLALKFKPSLVEEAEDKLSKYLSDESQWAPIIKGANDAWAKQKAQAEQRKKMLEEMEKGN